MQGSSCSRHLQQSEALTNIYRYPCVKRMYVECSSPVCVRNRDQSYSSNAAGQEGHAFEFWVPGPLSPPTSTATSSFLGYEAWLTYVFSVLPIACALFYGMCDNKKSREQRWGETETGTLEANVLNFPNTLFRRPLLAGAPEAPLTTNHRTPESSHPKSYVSPHGIRNRYK